MKRRPKRKLPNERQTNQAARPLRSWNYYQQVEALAVNPLVTAALEAD